MTTARLAAISFCGVLASVAMAGSVDENRWWPVQALPKALVRAVDQPQAPFQMLLQSVAGLAAQAVNDGRGDELVWVATTNVSVEDWYARLREIRPELEVRGTFEPWELVERFMKAGVVKGYILYRADKGGETRDFSVNVATSMAGLLGGIIVDESLKQDADAHGLRLLFDARTMTQRECFESNKKQFTRRLLCTQDPRKPNCRDLAIAQRALTIYGSDEPLPSAMEWLEPLSPILGWNGGDEFETTHLSTVYGHFQTATDWCMNMPVLMAGTENLKQPKVSSLNPQKIDWSDKRSAVSFICSDGDNVQWYEGDFFHNSSYWFNSMRGLIPFGWSCCFAHLSQLCPQAINRALATQTPNDSFIEFGGGYYYPDLFGSKRANRWELLATHTRRTWELMKRNNTRIIGFNVSRYDSPDALKAYEVIAGQTDGLLAILVFQYAPYEAGAGKTFWVKDRNGIELPVLTVRYAIWGNESRPCVGTPAKVAREIRQTVERTPQGDPPRYDWVIAHVWSYFKHAPGNDEKAEDMPKENAESQGGLRGYTPAVWCAERLPQNVHVIGPEELLWRIRMQHNPEQTRQFMEQFRP